MVARMAAQAPTGQRPEPLDLTVVIPTYNRPDFLRETLDSVLAQTRPAREIIVVDNGSDDETQQVLESYGTRVACIRMQPVGQQAARNAGIAAASSAWIATLDDDDLYQPTFLEEVAPAIEDGRATMIVTDHRKFFHPHGGRVSAQTNFQSAPAGYWDDLPRSAPGDRWSYVGPFPPERLLRFNIFYPSNTLVRKDLFLRVGGYDPGVRGIKAEDLEFTSRALPAADLAIVWKDLVDYRIHANNTSVGPIAQRFGRWRIFERVHSKNEHGSSSLAAALEESLPRRRVDVFDLAFRQGMFAIMDEVGPRLRPHDWTAVRKTKAQIARLPGPVARAIILAARLLQPVGRKSDAQDTRRWSRSAQG